MRKNMLRLINTEIRNAKRGGEAYITLKLNSLVDTQLITKLYEASEAGVKIRLMVRGMFSLVPGLSGLSSNIEATCIIDKFLEHSRIYLFCNGGDERIFISSADWMPRNIDRRIEVTCPIYDESIKEELRAFLDIQWRDNVKSRILNEKLDNTFVNNSKPGVRAQIQIYDYLKKQIAQV
jgi:polyphosphate kinase